MDLILVFLVGGIVIFFVFLVIWSAVRVARLSSATDRVEQLDREMDRLRNRLTMLEKRSPEVPRGDERPAAVPSPVVAPHTVPQTESIVHEARSIVPQAQSVVPQPLMPASVSVTPPPLAQPAPQTAPPLPPSRPAPTSIPTPVRAENSVPAVAVAQIAPTPARPKASLEERLGRNWLNKLGIITLVTGIALLLGYQLRTLGPVGKSIIGFLLSSAILVTGLVMERRERYRIFARAAIGGGWALLFFVTFALFHVQAMQVLHSQATDLVLMLIVAAGMVLHSLRYRSQVVTSLAFLLAFFTVSISHVTLFSLVAGAILAAGLVVVAFRQRWFVLALGGLVAVYLNHFVWLYRLLPDGAIHGHPFPEFLPSAALLLFYWLLFRVFYIFRIPENDGDSVCSTLNVLLNSAGLLTLLKYQSTHPEWAFRGLLALGVVELVLAFVARRRHRNAFVALTCIASLLLLAAVPFHFAGSSWSLAWLLESEMLFVTGLALRETVFRRLGLLSAFAVPVQTILVGAMPVFELRQLAPDSSHHVALSLAFGCAALAAWFNAEVVTRRWTHLLPPDSEREALRVLSYIAALSAGTAVWLTLAGPWTLLPWLAIALLLTFASERLHSADLAQQADLINLAVVARVAIINFTQWDNFAHAPRTLILLASSALLYLNMRRRQPSYLVSQRAIEPAYTWVAAGVLSVLAWYTLEPAAVAVAWCLLGTVLLETGLAARRTFFREQGFVLLVASFVRLFFINIALAPTPRLYTMLPLAAVYAWAYQRLYASEQPTRTDRFASAANAWFALGTIATLLYFSLRPEWVAPGGAALGIAVLLLARVLGRPLFSVQALTVILIAAARTLAFNVISTEPLSASVTEGRLFTTGITCALFFAALPIAFSLRKQQQAAAEAEPEWLRQLIGYPEQVLFFAPLLVLFVLIPIQLREGMITVGWSALGLLTFLFALTVGERSFRLAGLGVLLVGLGKIVTVDIWNASPTDRYITLIVMGAVLLLVSFLYSRYRETILELL